jgi:hypothetical protein
MSWITSTLWRLIATIASKPSVALWIIQRAQRTPYFHIMSADGSNRYMGRWWLFNPYGRTDDGEQGPARYKWLPSVRVHHIMRPDLDRHLHDHPWNARTIILRGWYSEERPTGKCTTEDLMQYCSGTKVRHGVELSLIERSAGYTGRLLFGQYHRIARVPDEGVWTIFITWKKRGTWGFDVDGVKVPHREYLAKQGAA